MSICSGFQGMPLNIFIDSYNKYDKKPITPKEAEERKRKRIENQNAVTIPDVKNRDTVTIQVGAGSHTESVGKE